MNACQLGGKKIKVEQLTKHEQMGLWDFREDDSIWMCFDK